MIGALLQDRYRLEAEIGRGGMGVVYRAHDTLLGRDVAVKLLAASLLGPEGRARLLREARAAAQLDHPNIVAVHDVGESDGTPYIVMQLVEGESLHRRRPVGLDEVLAIARQVCAALDHAHAHGIVHRDLKPANVMLLLTPLAPLTPSPSPKMGEGLGVRAMLTDFGLARSASATSRLTAEGAIVGTLYYLAPEQALDTASALHKLGYVARHRRDHARARSLFAESLAIQREAGNKQGIAECLFGLAGVSGETGQPERAARLFAAAQALLDAIGAPLAPADRAEVDRDLAALRAQLDPAVFASAWAEGRAMTTEQAVAESAFSA